MSHLSESNITTADNKTMADVDVVQVIDDWHVLPLTTGDESDRKGME